MGSAADSEIGFAVSKGGRQVPVEYQPPPPRRRFRSFLLIFRPCFASKSASAAFRSRRPSLIACPRESFGSVDGCSFGPEGDHGFGGS